jgi:hypothetical protein
MGISQHIRFDIDHDDMPACGNRRAGMADANRRIAGCLNHDIRGRVRDRAHSVIGECGGGYPRFVPADNAAGVARTIRRQIDDRSHFKTRRVRHLCEKHRAELPGSDQDHADGATLRVARIQHVMQIHRRY